MSIRQHAGFGAAAPDVPEPSLAERARTLASLGRIGSLSTHSRKFPGFPFGSMMPYAADDLGRAVFFISTMATHTQNLQQDSREELESEDWLRLLAQLSDHSYEQIRVAILEFLDTNVFNVSVENCVSFLDPMIESWDIDLKTFGVEVALNRRLAAGSLRRFEFVEQEPQPPLAIEPGFEQFLMDKSLSGDATEEEIEFLKALKLRGRRPAPLYYYRELQNLRDPVHFRIAAQPGKSD